MRKRLLEGALALLVLGGVAQAAPKSPVSVTNGWFRALPAQLPAGGYFTAYNAGTKDLAITGASAAACGQLMLHRSSSEGGVSKMEMVDKVDLPAGGTAVFSPGGYHLMCMDAKLAAGEKVPVTITLSDGSSVVTSFLVKDARGK